MPKFKLSEVTKLMEMTRRNDATKKLAALLAGDQVSVRTVEVNTPDGVVAFSDEQPGAAERLLPELAGQGLELVRTSVAAELARQEQAFADMGVDITA